MKHGLRRLSLLLAMVLSPIHAASAATPAASAKAPAAIRWQAWSDDVFERARADKKLVLLDLEAVWCHWCHVMDHETYVDPAVVRLLGEHYIALKVDQDARPDLSNRYEDYGWPATIIFASDGTELVKRSGYIPPPGMAALLQAVVDDPTPGPSAQPSAALSFSSDALPQALRQELQSDFLAQYDTKHGGWGFVHKFLDAASAEYGLLLARRGDALQTQRMRQTLDAQRQLIDPVWGGVYQYSTGGDWKQPHFEKIMATQTANLRIYSQAFLQMGRPEDLRSARAIHAYLTRFLRSPEGAFYTSQDADVVRGEHADAYFKLGDAARRKLGMPRIDTHRYSRENGWAIEALVAFHAADSQAGALKQAIAAADWIIQHRALPGGGFRHDEKDSAGPYLGDSLAMSRAFLALYSATADRAWLARAVQAADFIDQRFGGHSDSDAAPGQSALAGYATAVAGKGVKAAFQPQPLRPENIDLARFANLLHAYTGKPQHRAMAERALRYLLSPTVARRFPAAGLLLVDGELAEPALHLTVVGARSDATARALFDTAQKVPTSFKRLEWWDRSEGPLPNNDVPYPKFAKPAAFLCTGQRCSTPMFDPKFFAAKLQQAVKAP